MHPVCLALFGIVSSVFGSAAHDGKEWDLNDHNKHHSHCNVNFGLYWGFWDHICGTRFKN
jgi:Delta7-sterol 5-desaturase